MVLSPVIGGYLNLVLSNHIRLNELRLLGRPAAA